MRKRKLVEFWGKQKVSSQKEREILRLRREKIKENDASAGYTKCGLCYSSPPSVTSDEREEIPKTMQIVRTMTHVKELPRFIEGQNNAPRGLPLRPHAIPLFESLANS